MGAKHGDVPGVAEGLGWQTNVKMIPAQALVVAEVVVVAVGSDVSGGGGDGDGGDVD